MRDIGFQLVRMATEDRGVDFASTQPFKTQPGG